MNGRIQKWWGGGGENDIEKFLDKRKGMSGWDQLRWERDKA